MKRSIFPFLLISILALLMYANALNNSFHFDDQHYVVENPYIQDLGNIPEFFKSSRYSSFDRSFTGHYRPLVVTSYALNYAAGGVSPLGYHLVNLFFHVGSAFLVFLIMRSLAHGPLQGISSMIPPAHLLTRTPLFPSLAAGLIFLVHPFNSEVVNYITARSSVMCAFFYLLAFYFWIKYRESVSPLVGSSLPPCGGGSGWGGVSAYRYYIASLLSFLLAMLSKEIAITLPVVLWLYDFYFGLYFTGSRAQGLTGQRVSGSTGPPLLPWRIYLSYLPFILSVVIPYLLIRKLYYGAMFGQGFSVDFWVNLISQPMVLVKYLQLLIFPAGLTIDHDIQRISTFWDPQVLLPSTILLALGGVTYLLWKMGHPWRAFSFFILWFFITLLPTTVVPLNAILQENRGYLAGVGFAALVGIALGEIGRYRGASGEKGESSSMQWRISAGALVSIVGLILLLAIYSMGTFQRNMTWQDDLSLWTDAVRKAPTSPRSLDNLGLALHRTGRRVEAEVMYRTTLAVNPNYLYAHYNLGVLYQEAREWDRAERAYRQVLLRDPQYYNALYNLGLVYRERGDYDLAIEAFQKAIRADSRPPQVYNNLGVVYHLQGNLKKALEAYETAVQKDPGHEKAYYNLGSLFLAMNDRDRAIAAYQKVLQIDPGHVKAREKLTALLRTPP